MRDWAIAPGVSMASAAASVIKARIVSVRMILHFPRPSSDDPGDSLGFKAGQGEPPGGSG
jgi:hypothetical protein